MIVAIINTCMLSPNHKGDKASPTPVGGNNNNNNNDVF